MPRGETRQLRAGTSLQQLSAGESQPATLNFGLLVSNGAFFGSGARPFKSVSIGRGQGMIEIHNI